MKKVGTQPQKTGTKVKASVRNSNVELLRLASMFMIVLSHFAIHSPFSFDAAKVTPNSVYVQLTVLGNLGVNIFVLISGYFLYTGGEIRIRRYRGILPLWHGMFFSSAMVYGILATARLVPFSPVDMVKSCFPLLLEEWWFATTYVMLLLLHPFLNRMLHSLDQRSHLLLLLVFFVTWTCVPTLTGQELKCSDLLWFVNVYCWGAYIKKYRETALKMKASHCFLAAAALYLMFCLSVLAIDGIGVVLPLARGKALIFAERKNSSCSRSPCACSWAQSRANPATGGRSTPPRNAPSASICSRKIIFCGDCSGRPGIPRCTARTQRCLFP